MIRVRSVSALDSRGKTSQRTQIREGKAPNNRDIGTFIGRQLEKKKKDGCENFTSNTSGGIS